MEQEKKRSPYQLLWEWAGAYHGSFYAAVIFAVLGAACSMILYFCAAGIIRLLLEGCKEINELLPYFGGMLSGYAGKVIFSCVSTGISHKATYATLQDLRKKLIAKLSRVPMGTILETPSGQYKTTIVDRVEGMEPTLAHLLPEMTANVIVPIVIAAYIFVLDWRMGLASLVTFVIGMIVASQSGKTYAVRWEGAVKTGKRMADAIVEYVGGIQVVKAFSQSAGSYHRYADAVNDNAQYYVDWMHDNQKYMASMQSMQSIVPAVLVTILPVGTGLWAGGSLSAVEFFTIILTVPSVKISVWVIRMQRMKK